MPLRTDIKKVLVIGSGPIVIGQAAEFDYAGAQACRVLRNEGIETVLVNSNPATIMTDTALADHIYLEPLNAATVKRIIEKERPDSLLAGLGGQIGLTIAMQLHEEGFLEQSGVKRIGTNVEAIIKAEDRQAFKDTMEQIGQPCIPSGISVTYAEALAIANEIGYPVIIRPAFTMGGAGGGVCYDENELNEIANNGLSLSPIHQILVEKYIAGWYEIEFEVMRDGAGNAIAICSMENVDPVGVHTGDSIVVAPAQTLGQKELSMLRAASLSIIDALQIEGGCNCQFALDPASFDYAVIEVNPRVSRSSALASKATGYPIAKVTTKIALGYTLPEIKNDVTGVTMACFEPAVDYVVLKFPKWPFDKFVGASRKLGTQMKATGEVMSIAPSFEMALMKAVRGAEIKQDTMDMPQLSGMSVEDLALQDDLRIFRVFKALQMGASVDEVNRITRINKWFLTKIKHLVDFEADVRENGLDDERYLKGKQYGYLDRTLERLAAEAERHGGRSLQPSSEAVGNALRGVPPLAMHRPAAYKMVDTCAAEFPAQTPYFYATYDDHCEARERTSSGKPRIIVLGSGPIRIGQGIEFDYSSVHCVWTLKQLGYEVAIINNNPETVSTDFDTADRLYFEPLTEEDVMNVIEVERPDGVVVAFGGQTAINLTAMLDEKGLKILGTSAEGIDVAEDRGKFDQLLGKYGIRRPQGRTALSLDEALQAANELTYPVLLRPSYVIGGQNMTIAGSDAEVRTYMKRILSSSSDNVVLIDKYMKGTELEVDVISDGTDVLIPGIMEHIEKAGVHSGDSIAIYPPVGIDDMMLGEVIQRSEQLALALGTKGLVNIQYLIYEGELYVIEVNPRASRTIPYISKVTGVPMVELASRVMLGEQVAALGFGTGLYKVPPYIAVKVPVFSFEKLSDANATLGPQMKSTGEVLGIGTTRAEALYKGLASAGFKITHPSPDRQIGVLFSVAPEDVEDAISLGRKFVDLGAKLYATEGTAKSLACLGSGIESIAHIEEQHKLEKLVQSGVIDYIVITGVGRRNTTEAYIALQRQALLHGVACLTSLDTADALADIIASRFTPLNTELVDIAHLRTEPESLSFSKMEGSGNDYIFFNNWDGAINCPESLAIKCSDRHYGIGGDGIVLIEKPTVEGADAKMRIFNRDGTEGKMAGNCIRCVGKYVYDKDLAEKKNPMVIQTASGLKKVELTLISGEVRWATASMGEARLNPAAIPVNLPGEKVLDRAVSIGGATYPITCVSMGNPHCVVFVDELENLDLQKIGPKFEHNELFPDRVNAEFVRVINKNLLKMRAWERGNGETLACGTGACAAVVAATEKGLCQVGEDVVVRVRGGKLTVRYDGKQCTLRGNANLICEGVYRH